MPGRHLIVGSLPKLKVHKLIAKFEKEMSRSLNYVLMPTSEFNYRRSVADKFLMNLLENAMKFRRQEPCYIHISAVRDGHEWVFCVADDGIGIDPQHAQQLFRIFKRLHGDQYEGTGIGLAICKKIVTRHGGRIWIDSTPGRGARFYFTLPAAAELESE